MENKNIKLSKNFVPLSKPDFISLSNDFQSSFLSLKENPELLKVPIIAYRIIFKIISDLRGDTFSTNAKDEKSIKRNILQLSLFDEDFRTVNNSYGVFKYKMIDLDPNRNTANIKKSLEFLEQYKKGWYTQINSKGKKITSYGGLISQPTYTEGEVSFLISSYWLEKIVHLNNFNDLLFNVLNSFRETNQLFFYLWLSRIGEKGTGVKYTTLNNMFLLNYKSARSLNKDFIQPFRKKINEISDFSFNTKVVGDKINFITYDLQQTNNLKPETVSKIKLKYKIKYLKDRHNLSNISIKQISHYLTNPINFTLFENDYKEFVVFCRKNKIKTDSIQGNDFLQYVNRNFTAKNIVKIVS